MTSDQQESDLNNAVTIRKSGTKLNPNADAFFYHKVVDSTLSKSKESTGEGLTNGDVALDDLKGGPCGRPLTSDSAVTPLAQAHQDTAPVLTPDPMVGTTGSAGMPGGAGTAVSPHGEVTAAGLQSMDQPSTVAKLTVPLSNGFGLDSGGQESDDGRGQGVQSPEASHTDLRSLLLHQLEYYFSRENLVQDHYLQSQMDGDQYVSISIIANFNQVVKLTRDYDLIVDILRSSKLVQVDSSGTKVRPKHNRSVLMLREIPEDTHKWEVELLFKHEKCPKVVNCEFAHNGYWYVTFNTDEEAAAAYSYLREYGVKFRDKPVLARIKAKPLMRGGGGGAGGGGSSGGGGSPFAANTLPNGQQQQDAGGIPFLQQPPVQFPVMAAPMSQFASQQHVTQAIPQFQLYNYQAAMMPHWGGANNNSHPFLDPGAMLAMNGYQATSIKPSTNHSRNVFHPIRSNNRGMGKPHHRPQSVSTDKVVEPRPVDRPHSISGMPSTHMTPRHTNHRATEFHPLLPPTARSRSEGSSSHGRPGNQLHGSVSAPPTPLVPDDRLPFKAPPPPPPPPPLPPSSKSYPLSTTLQQRLDTSGFRRGTNYRRPRRGDETTKIQKSHFNPGEREEKPTEHHFELEPTSFPPLPGSTNNSSSYDAPEGNRLSDVVRGTATHTSVRSEEGKAVTAPSAAVPATVSTCSVSAAACALTHPAASAITSAILTTVPVSSTASGNKEEKDWGGKKSVAPSVTSACAKSVSTQSPVVVSTANMTPSQPVSTVAAVSVEVSPSVLKEAAVSVAPSRPSPAANPVPAPATVSTVTAQEAASTKLSYAQMVARKQQSMTTAKLTMENGVPSQATPTPDCSTMPTTAQEHTQPSTTVSTPAHTKSTSVSASASFSGKETTSRNFEPKPQRFQGNRLPKDFRDNRRPRFDRHQGDYDVKVLAK